MNSVNPRRTWHYRMGFLLAGACLLLIGLLVLVSVQGEAAQNRTIEAQKELLAVKNELIRIEQHLQITRQAELLFLAGSGSVDPLKIKNDLEAIIAAAVRLRQDLEPNRLVDPLVRLEKISQRYLDSVMEATAEYLTLGLTGKSGILSQLRAREDRITADLARLDDPVLDAAFLRMCVGERHFAESLNMKLATALKRQCLQLRDRIAVRNIQPGLKSQLGDELKQFEADISKITRSLLALELLVAHNTLQFDRLLPNLAQAQNMLDENITTTTESMSALRRTTVSKIILIFSGFLILFGAFAYMEFRGARELVRRLGLLSAGMSEVGLGHYSTSMPLPGGADEVGVLATAFSTMAERIREQISTINQERENAEKANRAKDTFLANMSHEIRTPMNGMLGMLELMELTPLNEKQKGYTGTLRHSSEALMAILNDILDYSKIEAGMLDLDLRVFSLSQFTKEVVCLFLPEAHRKGLCLTSVIDPRVPEWVEGDAHRLRQIFTNLLGNACKFTHNGAVGLTIQTEAVKGDEATIAFTFDDSGIGMDSETLERIFNPFVQADASTTRNHGGTGLGLAICRMLVARMGGSLRAKSEPGSGSRFFLCLPFKVSNEQAAEPRLAKVLPRLDRAEFPPLSMLVVEDNAVNRTLAIEILQSLGVSADMAVDGVEAVGKSAKKAYDLILMDIQMPRMDGYEATTRILERQIVGRGPVIVGITANAYKKDREKCLAHGMHDFLSKPFTIADFAAMVDRWAGVIYADFQRRD